MRHTEGIEAGDARLLPGFRKRTERTGTAVNPAWC